MNFKKFYKSVNFELGKEFNDTMRITQGDANSRGLYVMVVHKNVPLEIDAETMEFVMRDPNDNPITIDAVNEDGIFRVDFDSQVSAFSGIGMCALVLYGTNSEKVTEKKFKIIIDENLEP